MLSLLLSLALPLVGMVLDIGVNEEDNYDKDVGQDEEESLHAPNPPTELPKLYPMTIPPRRRRLSNRRWQRLTRQEQATWKPHHLIPPLYS